MFLSLIDMSRFQTELVDSCPPTQPSFPRNLPSLTASIRQIAQPFQTLK
jgi:hypothetical protein